MIHSVLHLKTTVERCGPLVNCNQFWMERFIGESKERLHATRLAAESLHENAKFAETVKLFFNDHFVSRMNSVPEPPTRVPLPPRDEESLNDETHKGIRTRSLLGAYLQKSEGLHESAAKQAVQNNRIWCFGRVRLPCGDDSAVIGACRARRHRQQLSRADWFFAGEFRSGELSNRRDVYYGRVLKVLIYEFLFNSGAEERVLLLADWSDKMEVNGFGEVFRPCAAERAFSGSTIEDPSVYFNSIGVFEHKIPGVPGRRTYFVDPSRASNGLLVTGKLGPDGIDRLLRGRA